MSGNCLFPDSARFFSLSYLYLVFRHSETFPFVYLSRTYVVAPQTFACLNYRNPISLTEFSVADISESLPNHQIRLHSHCLAETLKVVRSSQYLTNIVARRVSDARRESCTTYPSRFCGRRHPNVQPHKRTTCRCCSEPNPTSAYD